MAEGTCIVAGHLVDSIGTEGGAIDCIGKEGIAMEGAATQSTEVDRVAKGVEGWGFDLVVCGTEWEQAS